MMLQSRSASEIKFKNKIKKKRSASESRRTAPIGAPVHILKWEATLDPSQLLPRRSMNPESSDLLVHLKKLEIPSFKWNFPKFEMLGKHCHPLSPPSPPALSLFQHQGSAEDEVVGWHHQLNGHEFEQTPGGSKDRGACCAAVHGVAKSQTKLSSWTTSTVKH